MTYLNLFKEMAETQWVTLEHTPEEHWLVMYWSKFEESEEVNIVKGDTPEQAIRLAYLKLNPIPKSKETGKLRQG